MLSRMAYSTLADVTIAAGGAKRLKQLADYNADTAADTDVIDAAISAADALINSYVAKRFKPPIAAPVPDAIRHLSARLAVLEMKQTRGELTESDDAKLDRATKWLEALAKGDVLPDIAPLPEKSEVIVDKIVSRSDVAGDIASAREDTVGYW